jgi:hypothetical protein
LYWYDDVVVDDVDVVVVVRVSVFVLVVEVLVVRVRVIVVLLVVRVEDVVVQAIPSWMQHQPIFSCVHLSSQSTKSS